MGHGRFVLLRAGYRSSDARGAGSGASPSSNKEVQRMPTVDDIKGWRGGTVVDRDGDKIGSVDEIYLDDETQEPEWLAVKTGLFGSNLTFVPLAQAERSGEDIRVPYEKSQVKDAPNVEADGQLSEQEEAELHRHYGLDYDQTRSDTGVRSGDRAPDGSRDVVGNDVSGPETDDAMTRSEEELRVGTRKRESGRMRLRKWVETEPVEQTVVTRRETARVEREPITDANVGDATSGPEISEEEHEVTLHADEPFVEKRVVPKERVRATTDVVTEEAEISDEVRKERIEADTDGVEGDVRRAR
jgi:stress response protein YsnF